MIKNASLVALMALAACSRARPTPPGYQGVIELDERTVSFEVAGRIQDVPVHEGDVVDAGATLAKLDDALEALTRDSRAAEVAVAKSDLALVRAGTRAEDIASLASQVAAYKASEDEQRREVDRTKRLVETGSVPSSQLERVQADLDRITAERRAQEERLLAMRRGARPEEIARADARVSSSSTAVALENERLARHTVKALVGGTVLEVHVKSGELAAPGTPVATLADVEHPYVDVFVPQGELGGMRVGNGAQVRTDASANLVRGKVEWISPKTEFTPRFLFSERERPNLVIRVRVRIDDARHELHGGVPAFVTIER